ncbi:MAG: GDSL-type esterase/lipase family protein [Desulfuromonadaceae bacterium]|nr:GDSL-type esterase/lipase family protein [Desulfuromonadaceae bacterium]MDD5106595.1 GDSL-type esterase/lipase family protein [Desulfuromonadaceae bacterium]
MSAKNASFLTGLLFAVLILCTACSKIPQLTPLAADATILAFGDSLTFGTGAGEFESYPAVLMRLTGRKIVNAGVPGEISVVGAQRLPELLEREHPALLILCHGGNDLLAHQSPQVIADNLRVMIRIAAESGVPVLLVAVPVPDLSLKPPPLYEELAKEFHIPIELKILPQILGTRNLKSDHIHPNAAGYRKFAEALAKLLKKSGALP